jgi:SPP1 family predicted phage head-tail adaptor
VGKVFNPGEFNKRITFLKIRLDANGNPERDTYGELTKNYDEFKKAWAKKFDLMGTDFYAAQTSDTKIEVKFNCIYVSGVTKDMRIQNGSEVYEIIGVPIDVEEFHRELLCYCRKVS